MNFESVPYNDIPLCSLCHVVLLQYEAPNLTSFNYSVMSLFYISNNLLKGYIRTLMFAISPSAALLVKQRDNHQIFTHVSSCNILPTDII